MLVPFCLLIIPVWQILKLEIVKFDCIHTYIRTSSGKKLCEIAKSWKLWVYRDSDCVQARAWNRLKIDCIVIVPLKLHYWWNVWCTGCLFLTAGVDLKWRKFLEQRRKFIFIYTPKVGQLSDVFLFLNPKKKKI